MDNFGNDQFLDGYIIGDTLASLPAPRTRTWWGAVAYEVVQAFLVTVFVEGIGALISGIFEHLFD